jgi:hypothetical protein
MIVPLTWGNELPPSGVTVSSRVAYAQSVPSCLIPERFDSYRAHQSSLRSERFRQEEPRHAGFAALVVGSAIVVSGPGVRAASDHQEAHAS